MSPQDYEYLLVAANLAQFHPKWGFSIKILKWKLFLEGHRFLTVNCMGTMEVSSKKLDLNAYVNRTEPTKNREQCHFIWIGILHHNSIEIMQKDSDGLMILTPPRLNGLRIKQQPFRQCVEQSNWNYLLEKEEEGGKDDDDADNNDEDDNEDTSSSFRCTAFSSSHRAGWLLR